MTGRGSRVANPPVVTRSAGWIITTTGVEYQIFTKMTQMEWLDMKILQISPKEGDSKYPTAVCLTFEYPSGGVPEVKKGV